MATKRIKGIDRVRLHRLLVGARDLDTAARWTNACHWKHELATYTSLHRSEIPCNLSIKHILKNPIVLNNVKQYCASIDPTKKYPLIVIIPVYFSYMVV